MAQVCHGAIRMPSVRAPSVLRASDGAEIATMKRKAMRTTAAVLRDPAAPYSLEELELPPLAADEVLVRIVSAGICHTDSLPRTIPGMPLPLVPGHEGAGVVEEVGADVSGIAVGDHVVLSFDSCGVCANCQADLQPYCDQFMLKNFVGMKFDGTPPAADGSGNGVGTRWFGQSSFATYAIGTSQYTVVVDKDVDLTILGPLGCGIQTGAGSVLMALGVEAGSSIAVYGAGGVGLAAVMAAKVAEASTIIAVDRHQHRLDLALELGATDVVLAADGVDVASKVQAISGGGTLYAFDTTGVPAVVTAALVGLRQTGVLGLVGAGGPELTFDPNLLFGKTVTGIFEGNANPKKFIPQMIELYKEGRFPFDRLIQTFTLDQVNEAEEASLDGSVIKPVLLPTTA